MRSRPRSGHEDAIESGRCEVGWERLRGASPDLRPAPARASPGAHCERGRWRRAEPASSVGSASCDGLDDCRPSGGGWDRALRGFGRHGRAAIAGPGLRLAAELDLAGHDLDHGPLRAVLCLVRPTLHPATHRELLALHDVLGDRLGRLVPGDDRQEVGLALTVPLPPDGQREVRDRLARFRVPEFRLGGDPPLEPDLVVAGTDCCTSETRFDRATISARQRAPDACAPPASAATNTRHSHRKAYNELE